MADRIVYGLGKTVIDEDLEIVDEGDSTKKLQWEVSGIATGTTVTMTAPTSDIDINNIPASPSLLASNNLSDVANAGTSRTNLGLVIGTNVQAFDADTSITDVAETRAAEINMADNILQRPKIKDYSETVNDIGVTGGGTQDIDLELGNVAILMVTTNTNTLTFSNWPATGIQGSLTLKIFGGGTQTVNFPSVMKGDTPTLTDNTATFTTDFGTDEKLDITAHGFMNGDRVQLTTTTTLPAGLSLNTLYFVINKTANDFELSLTEGGAAVNITDDGTGTHTCHSGLDIYIIETDNSGLTLNIYAAKEDMK